MIRKTLLAAAIAGLALQAQAASVTFKFDSDGFDAGTLIGQTLNGQFSFDDATLTAATEWLPVSSFSFQLGGQTYTLTAEELGAAAATFSNGQVNGVEAVAMNVATRAFSFVGGSFGAPFVFYIDSEGTDLGAANLSFTAAVPEPQTYALMLGGLGLVGWMARRRKA